MKRFIPMILLAALVLPAPVLAGVAAAEPQSAHARQPNHLFAKHDFGTTPEVIDFGIQPLAVPIGVIAEVMKRDRILASALRQRGLEIRFHPFLKGEDINCFLRQGKIDVAMAGDMPTLVTASSANINIVALVKQGFSSIVARGPLSIADLKGKRIGFPAVSNAHYALLTALSSQGLKETDVRMIPMDISEMVSALTAGRIDAFSAWEPVPSIALKKINDATIVYKYFNSSYLYFSRQLVDRHPEAACLLVASLIRAFVWMKKNEEHLLMASKWTLATGERLQGTPFGLSAEEIAVLTMRDILSISNQPTIPERDLTDKGSIRKKFDFLKSRGKIAPAIAWEKVIRSFDRGLIGGVMANPKKFRLNSFDYAMGKADR